MGHLGCTGCMELPQAYMHVCMHAYACKWRLQLAPFKDSAGTTATLLLTTMIAIRHTYIPSRFMLRLHKALRDLASVR